MRADLLILLAVVLLVVVGAVAWWLWRRSSTQPRLGSFKQGNFCYPCASPIDAQFGSRLYIAGKANVANAQRRFFLHNNSGQTMTVKSFTFGGYNRKFRDAVTEMVQDNLMQQYGYSNVVPSGGVFSLDVDNDAHVMYKGWYNGPLFIAYCLGPETRDTVYTVLGWAPMRLQDETVTYKYFYDDALKKDLLAKVPDEEHKAYKQMMGQKQEYKLARNGAVHWETGSGPGKARPLPTISSDKNSQCRYVTTVNTFDAVNVHVPLAHLGVKFVRDPTRGNSIADCLRQIATIGSSAIMDKSADKDNFMVEPKEWMPILVTAIATALWFYVELSGIAVNVMATVLNAFTLPFGIPLGTAVSFLYDMTVLATKVIAGSGVLANVPGIGEQLNEIGLQYANGNTITDIASPFITVLDAATAAAAGNFAKGAEAAAKAAAMAALKKGVQLAAKEVLKRGVAKLSEKFPALGGLAGDVLITVLGAAIDLGVAKGGEFLEGKFDSRTVVEIIKLRQPDDLSGSLVNVLKDVASGQISGAAAEIALILNDKAGELLERGIRASTQEVIEYIGQQIAVGVSQVAPPTGEGRGKEKWKPGKSGKGGYALDRKLWVNRELKKGKFAKDAACSGNWEITYFN